MPRAPEEIPEAVLRLALASEAGPAFHHAAFAALGSWEAVVRAPAAELLPLTRMQPDRAARIHDELRRVCPDTERRAMERIGAQAVVLGDADYPPLLAPVPQPPIMLWVRGRTEAFHEDAVGIVGARQATAYGRAQAARFAAAAAAEGVAIVSGGARGVDAEAHRAALRVGGTTIAVLGCGLGEPYPPEHVRLFEEIVEAGSLLASEFPAGWPPMAANFPRRNRIISGLSLTVLVVEAGVSSGALITARHAIDDHLREPCALPGPVDSARSAGCNAAIRDGWAHAVLDPEDMLRLLDGNAERMGRPAFVRPDLEALGLPEELRAPVVRAAEVMARRPRIGIEDLASTLEVDASRARIIRTFAEMLLAQVGAARRTRGRELRTVVGAPRSTLHGDARGGTGAAVSPECQVMEDGIPPSLDQVQPMA